MSIKKIIIVCVIIVLVVAAPIAFLLIPEILGFQSTDSKIEDYCDYLYFNWIEYPEPVTELREDLFASPEVHEQVLDWFGYDEQGYPVEEKYGSVSFAYNTPFIFESDYVGIPWNTDKGIQYKMLLRKGGKFYEAKESIW